MTRTTARAFVVGDTWTFKRTADPRYGATAQITALSTSIDAPHPGFLHHQHIDLVTATGIALQWPPATLRRVAR